MYTKKTYLKHNIAAIEKRLPIKFNDIISLSKVDMEKECVVYTLQMNGLYKTEMNDKLLTAMDKKQKQDILASMYDDIKHNKFIATCLEYGYVVRLDYVDAISLPLFQFEITPEEYKSSIGR